MKNILLIAAIGLAASAQAQPGAAPLAKFAPSVAPASVPEQASQGYELVSFVGIPVQGEGIMLRWNTAGEVPGCLFTVERSADRMNWHTAFTQDAEGGTEGYTGYEVMDMAPLPGISYYRLIASADGHELGISDDFGVDYTPAPALQFSNAPVPGRFRVQGDGAISELHVLNNRGQFMPMDLHYDRGQVLVNTEGLEPGTYFVQAVVDGTPVLRSVTVTATGIIGG